MRMLRLDHSWEHKTTMIVREFWTIQCNHGTSLGIGEIRRAVSGGALPSPRLISNLMQKSTIEAIDPVNNNLVMQFGQMIAHDVVFGPSATGWS